MKTNLSHEFYKMIRQRSSWVAVIVFFGLMLYSATPTAYITKNLISQVFGTGQWVIIIMITLSANFIAMELKNNTMTTLLYKSPNRWGVFVAKLIVLIVYSIILLIAGFIFTLIIKAVLVNSHFAQQFVTKFAINNEVSVFDQILQIAQQFCKKFQKQPQVMDFLFFNPTIIQVYQADKDDFSFLQTIQRLAQQVNPGILNDQQFFEQLWSFIQGYSLLIKNGVITYDPQVVKVTPSQIVGGK